MNNMHRLNNNMKMNKNEETECIMIGNVLELIEVVRREVVVREVGIVTLEFLAAMSFAIHVTMQLVLKVLICV
jgi:hypothetical protein